MHLKSQKSVSKSWVSANNVSRYYTHEDHKPTTPYQLYPGRSHRRYSRLWPGLIVGTRFGLLFWLLNL